MAACVKPHHHLAWAPAEPFEVGVNDRMSNLVVRPPLRSSLLIDLILLMWFAPKKKTKTHTKQTQRHTPPRDTIEHQATPYNTI